MDLYYMPESAKCRAVMMTAVAIGVDLNCKHLNILNGEQHTPEFLKLNPQHCIPTLDDNGFILWESQAIAVYLVEQYAKTDSLYPKDLNIRAKINQLMYFNEGTLFKRFNDYFYPQAFDQKPADPAAFESLKEAVQLLDTLIAGNRYACNEYLSVADFSLLATISTLHATGFDLTGYKHVLEWFDRCKRTAPGYARNQEGADKLKSFKKQ